tara:strand:- start:104 stop:508 length:405 start_codon:yes stop_codon:yes gene_type:complete
MSNLALKAVNQYQSADNSSIVYANPHELILRLMNGALERIAQARGAIQYERIDQKGEYISKAISIIGGLSDCLDHSQPGDLSENLSLLYQYMSITLSEANISNDSDKLEEVSRLLLEIKSAWVQLPQLTGGHAV